MIHLKKFRLAINRAQKNNHAEKLDASADLADAREYALRIAYLNGVKDGLEKGYKIAEELNK